MPTYAAADKNQVYLAWNGAEAGKAVLAVDLAGNIQWSNIRGGIAGASALAADGEFLYVLGGLAGPPAEGASLYKLDAKSGSYVPWDDKDTVDLQMNAVLGAAAPGDGKEAAPAKADAPVKGDTPVKADGVDARGGQLYLSFAAANAVAVLDAKTGRVLKKLQVPAPRYLKSVSDSLLYAVSQGQSVVAVNPQTGEVKNFADGFKEATGLAVDASGNVYVAERATDNQVLVLDVAGKRLAHIGRPGGRAPVGAWTPDGMTHAAGMAIDAAGKLWVAEADAAPKRISVWETASGKLLKEFFGPSATVRSAATSIRSSRASWSGKAANGCSMPKQARRLAWASSCAKR